MPETCGWQKSSYSGGGDGNNCVEARSVGGVVLLRESADPGAVLALAPRRLGSLLGAVRDGRVAAPR